MVHYFRPNPPSNRPFLFLRGCRKLAVNVMSCKPQSLFSHQLAKVVGIYPLKARSLTVVQAKHWFSPLHTFNPPLRNNDSTTEYRRTPHSIRTSHKTSTSVRLRWNPHSNRPQRRRSNPPQISSQLAQNPRIVAQKRRLGHFRPRPSIPPSPARLTHQCRSNS